MKALAITPTTPAERLRRAIAGILDNALILPISGPKLGYGFQTLDDVVEALAVAAERNLTTSATGVDSDVDKINRLLLLTRTYFDTLSDTLDAVAARLDDAKATSPDDWRARLSDTALAYEQTRNMAFKLDTHKGKPVKNRGFNVSIYRMGSGRYELTFYIA